MGLTVAELEARFKVDTSDLRRSNTEVQALARNAQQSYDATGRQIDRVGARGKIAWDTIGRGARNTMVAGGLALGVMEKANLGFDKQMSAVNAATHEGARNMGLLRDAAIKAGADTAFSATEAAQGIENLAKAGVSTKDILGGGLKGALSLAAAGELDVGDAAEYMSTALTQFHLKGTQATHVADLLAAGAGKAQGEVSDMALALSYVGVPAANLGVSIEQTAGTIALFAKNGIIGERAGTSLRGMLASLTSPSKMARDEMDSLGISVFDAKGKFIGFDGVAAQLHKRLGGLTQEERANALGRIFGNEQLQAANVLYREGAKGVTEWTKKVNDSGYAADTAARKQDNLAGDLEKLGGSLESAFLKAGSGAQGGLRDVVQDAEHLVNKFSELPGSVQSGTVKLVAMTAVAGGLVYMATKLAKGFQSARTVFDGLRGATAARSAGGSLGATVASRGPVPVEVMNWGAAGLGGKGTPTVAGAPGGGKVSRGIAAGAGRVFITATAVDIAGHAFAPLLKNLANAGGGGHRSGLMSPFNRQDRPGPDVLLGAGHTFANDMQTAARAMKPVDHALQNTGQWITKTFTGLDSATTVSAKNVAKFDANLSTMLAKHPERGMQAYHQALKESGLSQAELNRVLPKTRLEMDAQTGAARSLQTGMVSVATAARKSGLPVDEFARKLSMLPKGVGDAIRAGAVQTSADVAKLARQFDLTKFQKDVLIRLVGGPEVLAEATRVQAKLDRLRQQSLDLTQPEKPNVHSPGKGGVDKLLLGPAGVKTPDLSKYAKQLKNIPAAVMTRISTPGAVTSATQVGRLAERYRMTPKQVSTVMQALGIPVTRRNLVQLTRSMDLVPKQVRTLIRESGGSPTKKMVESIISRAHELDKQKPTPHVGQQGGGQVDRTLGGLIGTAKNLDKQSPNVKISQSGAQAVASQAHMLSSAINAINRNVVVHYSSVGTTKMRAVAAGGTILRAGGGSIPGAAAGFTVPGPREPYGDKVMVGLAPGEEVTTNRHGEADLFRPELKLINAGASRREVAAALLRRGLAKGGTVNPDPGGTAPYAGMPLEVLEATRTIRDLNKELEDRKKKTKKGKGGGFAVVGLERAILQANLADAQGTLARLKAGGEAQGLDAATLRAQMLGGIGGATSAAGLVRALARTQTTNQQWASLLAGLSSAGLSKAVLDQITAAGPSSQTLALGKSILASPGTVAQLNALQGNTAKQADAYSAFATGKSTSPQAGPLVAIENFNAADQSPDEIGERLYFISQVRR